LSSEDRAQYDALQAILDRLNSIADALSKLPACPEPPKRAAAKFEWSGFYVGGSGGATWTKGDWTTTEVISLGGRDPLVDAVKTLYKLNPIVGVYFGYMFNVAEMLSWDDFDWYFGPEYYVDYVDAAMDPGIPGTGGLPGNKSSDSVTVRTKWDMALRARLAYLATPSTQLFVAGGPAWMHMDATVNCTGAGVCGTNGIPAFTQTNSTTKGGWTVGGGVEQQIWGRWRARLEYRYSDYGKWSTHFGTPANLSVAADIKLHPQSLMVGLTYPFGGF
jgi:outer membrane immunogenic protein